MCGITGFLALAGRAPASAETLDGMCRIMTHRGPDDQGTWLEGPVGLGMRRLAVIDVAHGKQPMTNEDGSLHVVFNGELYNYPALRERLLARGHKLETHSDTEVLVHLYEDHGEDFVQHLTGMFAIALWDAKQQKLLLARDRLGEKPLYYGVFEQQLLWGSELKCLLAHPAVPRRLSLPALARYLQLEYVPAPHAILEGVHKLPPAHILVAQGGETTVRPYWRLDLTPRPDPGEAAALAGLNEHLDRAVKQCLLADVPLGVFLSGGIDSSTVAALASRHVKELETFSIGFEDKSFDESSHARAVAKHLGTRHHEEILSPARLLELLPTLTRLLDEPFGDASVLPTYLLSAFARKRVTVALGGDGGDELLAGYPTYQAERLATPFDRLPGGLRHGIAGSGAAVAGRLPVNPNNLSLDFKLKRFTGSLARPALERHLRWLGSFTPEEQGTLLSADVRAALQGDDLYDQDRAVWAHSQGLDPTARVLHLDTSTYLPDDILFKVDRASMATSLEVRAPLLDHRLVEYVAGLPTRYKLRGLKTKYLLKQAARPLLPAEILDRPKKGFGIPVAKWLKAELQPAMRDMLSAERIRAGGLFDPVAVERLMADHLAGRHDHRKQLWTLLMFEWWREAYMRAEVPAG
ncbi:MAG: asparagine synthase, glutamine-hydrolyzing [Cyanobacteria bacterium RYN_339]|nr:asparagine synthase, glutamine-hydrolyzing [Cyanobacteria bacterium RYN_339]